MFAQAQDIEQALEIVMDGIVNGMAHCNELRDENRRVFAWSFKVYQRVTFTGWAEDWHLIKVQTIYRSL